MGRIRICLRRVPISAAFIICGLTCMLAALALTSATLWFVQKNITGIIKKYEPSEYAEVLPLEGQIGFDLVGSIDDIGAVAVETDALMVEYTTDLSETAMVLSGENVKMVQFNLLKEDQKKYDFFAVLDKVAAGLWYSVCLCIAAFVFYQWKIRKPYRLLNLAVQNISDSNLDFRIDYEGQDEFGHLCHAFEIMRQELVKSNQKMWNSIEERKRLNAAFAHDLRTPLTIMRGHTDLMLGTLEDGGTTDEEIRSFACEISDQITRLNAFVNTMGNLGRLEDYEPCLKFMLPSALIEMISETAAVLFPDGEVEIHSELNGQELLIDREALAQICENILSNAARYAKKKITIDLRQVREYVIITIEDDGKGFTKKDLANASLAYYRGENTGANAVSHFGLGLYISSLLAEKLGGNLTLANGEDGGAKIRIKIRWI